jgi:hypothetical protein
MDSLAVHAAVKVYSNNLFDGDILSAEAAAAPYAAPQPPSPSKIPSVSSQKFQQQRAMAAQVSPTALLCNPHTRANSLPSSLQMPAVTPLFKAGFNLLTQVSCLPAETPGKATARRGSTEQRWCSGSRADQQQAHHTWFYTCNRLGSSSSQQRLCQSHSSAGSIWLWQLWQGCVWE